MLKQRLQIFLTSMLFVVTAGCSLSKGNVGQVQSYVVPAVEAAWILRGEPIEFEGELWYPQDGIETILDSEVYLLMTYKGGQVFTDKIDVRPYNRLYTKFGYNQFRYFQRKEEDDSH